MANDIIISEQAADHIKALLVKRKYGLGLKIGLKKSGCSGYAYNLSFVDQVGTDSYQVTEMHGAKVYISSADVEVLSGLRLGLKSDKFITEFTFDNDNVSGECGCGKSFSINGTVGSQKHER